MSNRTLDASTRTLAEIENELLKAEAAYADADERLEIANRERRTALQSINEHQAEFDEALAALRQRSTPGSIWHPQPEGPDDVLALSSDDELADAGKAKVETDTTLSPPAVQSVSKHFERLRFHIEHNNQAREPRTTNGK